MVGASPQLTVLIVSKDPEVIAFFESVRVIVPEFLIEDCCDFSDVHRFLQRRDIALVAIHVTKCRCSQEVKEVLWAVNHLDRPVAPMLVLDEFDETRSKEFLRAGAACCLPREVGLRKLAHTLRYLTFRTHTVELAPFETAQPPAEVAETDPSFYVLSPEMMHTMEQVRHVVPQDTTILFTGETGTGKTRTARLIHEMSPRKAEPFLVVDCNALSSGLIESELFGHVKGAFTGADRDRPGKFAAAGKGTIVLDEINSLSLSLQSKLLRVVDDRVFEPVGSNQSQPLQARLITISNAALEQEVAAGRFRSDLFYRLNVVGFYMPPLRDRVSAIGPLAHKFMAQFAAKNRTEKKGIAREALRVLEMYHWPGNIREMANVIERATTLFSGNMIEFSHLPEALRANRDLLASTEFSQHALDNQPNALHLEGEAFAAPDGLTLVQTKEKAEMLRITEALHRNQNNRLRAARELGISRMALYKKLHKYGLYTAS